MKIILLRKLRFLPDEMAKHTRASFTGLYSLAEGEEGVAEIVKKAIANPSNYVLKPQREGGGNNVYGEDIVELVKKLSPTELAAYILMDRILPPPMSAHL